MSGCLMMGGFRSVNTTTDKNRASSYHILGVVQGRRKGTDLLAKPGVLGTYFSLTNTF